MADERDRGDPTVSGWRLRTAAALLSRSLRDVAVILGVDGVALMLTGSDGRLRAVGGSSAEGWGLEYTQQVERAGPAYDCLAADRPIAVPDLQRDDRDGYARVGRLARPVRAVLSVPVRVDGVLAGSVNFYCLAPHGWSADQIAAGPPLADALVGLMERLGKV